MQYFRATITFRSEMQQYLEFKIQNSDRSFAKSNKVEILF